MRTIRLAAAVTAVVLGGAAAALAAADPLDVDAEKLGSVLLVFLVLSLVFETAMTPIFNWRVFLRHFEGRGVKVPLTIGLAFLIFWGYDLDIVERLLTALGHEQSSNFGGRVLTALLIAGGSDGVFRVFARLGIRDPQDRREKAEQERAKMREA